MIAIIGADGSGKTTALDGLIQRLEAHSEFARIHMGTPPWGTLTRMIRSLLKAGRVLFRRQFVRESAKSTLFTDTPVFPGYGWLIYQACTASDRYHSYLKAKRLTSAGKLVLCDRYPVPQIRLADGPQIRRVTAGCRRDLAMNLLMRIEERCYQPICDPDLVLVLAVDPGVAVERKRRIFSNELPAQIAACAKEIRSIDWSGMPAHVIDANRPIDQVLDDMEQAVWSGLGQIRSGLLPESSSL